MGKYDKTLRPRKRILNLKYWGKFGAFDFTDEGILWKDMPKEALIEFCKVHTKETVERHLTGEIPKNEVVAKVSKAPETDAK